MEESFVPLNNASAPGSNVMAGDPNGPRQYTTPLVTVQDQKGVEQSFVPVLTPMNLLNVLVEMLDEEALKLSMTPGLNPEPDPEQVEAARQGIKQRVEAGYLNPMALEKVNPEFQVAYENNLNSVIDALGKILGGYVVRQRKVDAEANASPLIKPAHLGMIPPRSM